MPIKLKSVTNGVAPVLRAQLTPSTDAQLYFQAFDEAWQATIITADNGRIVAANKAARKLLGFTEKQLLSKKRSSLFKIEEEKLARMLLPLALPGDAAFRMTAFRNGGKPFPCEVTSVSFSGADGTEQAIISLADRSSNIRRQKRIDSKRDKTEADNIIIANTKQKNIDNINEEIVADNILLAQTKSDHRLESEIRRKDIQITQAAKDAGDTARSDIARELHDNVNQLLAASKMYLELGKRGGENSKMYFDRSSEYTLNAIEEIRKLTKGLITDIIKNLGLSAAIENLAHDTMETGTMKISWFLENFKEDTVSEKFKLNLFRIIQEQLNNILKHARAKQVVISLSQNKKQVLLSIADDGVGFDSAKPSDGIGLTNIKSRAAAYRGTACFDTQPERGCELVVRFPIAAIY